MIITLDDQEGVSIEVVGGKAAQLVRLKKSNFSVPDWFCVPTQAFHEFLSMHDAASELMANGVDRRDGLLKEMLKTPYRPDWRSELDKLAQERLDKSVASALVVRSSANVEDGANAAYAGQFDTFLGVDQVEEVWEKIKACWLSVFSDSAMEYTRNLNPTEKPAMAVVVQDFIPADVSGVMFTANPMTKNDDECVIESTWGLGEALVGGEVVPDQFVMKRAKDQAGKLEIQTKLGTKTKGLFWNGLSQKIEERKNARYFQRQASLHEEQLKKLVRLGEQIETCYGRPQDIEWAIHEDHIYILQTRPITTGGVS
ncbi:MAG: hypothetical protein GKR87_02290 [Kiritimatiellae bacterium]|nr:hypothetical protein [Kiritimatiellia bacterium]